MGWGWSTLAAVLFLGPFFLTSRFVGPELSNMVGAAGGGLVFVLLYRMLGRPSARPDAAAKPGSGDAPRMHVLQAAAPYLVLIILVLATRLIPPLQRGLSSVVWEWSILGIFSGRFQPLYQPGTLLFIALFLGALVKRASLADLGAAPGQSLRQVVPVTIALVAMLGVSKVMGYSGMIDSLSVSRCALSPHGTNGASPCTDRCCPDETPFVRHRSPVSQSTGARSSCAEEEEP